MIVSGASLSSEKSSGQEFITPEKFLCSTGEQRLAHHNNAAVQLLLDLPAIMVVWAEKKGNILSS